MTMTAIIFLALSWGGVLTMLVWSFARILRSDATKKP